MKLPIWGCPEQKQISLLPRLGRETYGCALPSAKQAVIKLSKQGNKCYNTVHVTLPPWKHNAPRLLGWRYSHILLCMSPTLFQTGDSCFPSIWVRFIYPINRLQYAASHFRNWTNLMEGKSIHKVVRYIYWGCFHLFGNRNLPVLTWPWFTTLVETAIPYPASVTSLLIPSASTATFRMRQSQRDGSSHSEWWNLLPRAHSVNITTTLTTS